MRKSRFQNRNQFALELEHPNPRPLMEPSAEGLIEVLADLLLEAVGSPRSTNKGGVDEYQDHA